MTVKPKLISTNKGLEVNNLRKSLSGKQIVRDISLKVEKGKVLQNNFPIYLDATSEDNCSLAAGDLEITNAGFIKDRIVPVRYRQNLLNVIATDVDYIAVSPIQVVSLATALILSLIHI